MWPEARRGAPKRDRVDAGRIAWFTCLHRRALMPMQLPSGCLLKLKSLMAFRDRLVKASTSLKNTLADLRETSRLIDNTLVIKLSQKQQTLIEQQITQIEKEMEVTVKQDEQVLRHFQLAKSVVGVGVITAVAFLIYTQGFTAFDNGRQFARAASAATLGWHPSSILRAVASGTVRRAVRPGSAPWATRR